jgi:hypothetical protein
MPKVYLDEPGCFLTEADPLIMPAVGDFVEHDGRKYFVLGRTIEQYRVVLRVSRDLTWGQIFGPKGAKFRGNLIHELLERVRLLAQENGRQP